MKLYSGPISLFTAKVRIALAEKGIDYERIEVGYSVKDAYLPHNPDVERLNPKGQVPVLVDDETVVYDSTLILEYLEQRNPTPALYSTDLATRAACRQLEAYGDEILFPDLWTLIEEVLYKGQTGASDAGLIEQARSNLSVHHQRLEEQLGGSDYFVGEFSVADITNFIFLNASSMLGGPIDPKFEKLRDWFARVGARPTVRAEIAAMQEFLNFRPPPKGSFRA